MSNIGTVSLGIKLPIIKEGENIRDIIVKALADAGKDGFTPGNGDIIGITESIVARAQGNYCTIDEIAEDLKKKFNSHDAVYVYNPIFSRNRFSLILKGVARAFRKVVIVADETDEVGNVIKHPITKVDYHDFYKEIVEAEGAEFAWEDKSAVLDGCNVLDCTLHAGYAGKAGCILSLKDIMSDKCAFGLLGSNKAGEELLKLFPKKEESQELVEAVKKDVEAKFGVSGIEVMIYGDGCYKDADSDIWEFADPVVSPAYTKGLEGSPNELKLKYLADEEFGNLNGNELAEAIKGRIKGKAADLSGTMSTQGTTPRRYVNLLGSLMDLTSGSGDKGTPVIVVRNYFKNYSD